MTDSPDAAGSPWAAGLLLAETHQLLLDHQAATVQDANLARLRSEDPDADLLFPPGSPFADAATDHALLPPLAHALTIYAKLKAEQGRSDLVACIFDGTAGAGRAPGDG